MKKLSHTLIILLFLITFKSYIFADEGQDTSPHSVADPFKSLEFNDNLREFSGKQVRAPFIITKNASGKMTYAREFKFSSVENDPIVSKYIRKLYSILYSNLNVYTALGEQYKHDGGFFVVAEPQADEAFFLKYKFDPESKYTIQLKYIIHWYSKKLKLSSGFDMDKLDLLLDINGINYFIHEFFEPVDMPKDSDLVLYECAGNPYIHDAGIYRSGTSSPYGGAVQSLVHMEDRAAVFEHDIFFKPLMFCENYYAKFYRIKSTCPYYSIVELWKNEKDNFKKLYTVDYDGVFHFNNTEENRAYRNKIDAILINDEENLSKEFPEIMSLAHIRAEGVCYHYALKNALKDSTAILPNVSSERLKKILDEDFIIQKEPKVGDLVVYYENDSKPVHYGIYYTEEIVESKWGHLNVYRHPIFYVANNYGDTVKFYKVKEK